MSPARSLVMVVAFAVGLVAAAATVPAGKETGGKFAPEFDAGAKDAKGKKFRMKALKGKWVAVTFGASWCKPCRKELPTWDKLAKTYAGELTFIAVNIDDDPADGAKFMKKLKVKNLFVVYAPEEDNDTSDYYMSMLDGEDYDDDDRAFPITFIIDPKGLVRHIHPGFVGGDDKKLAKQIDKLLKKKK